MLQRLNGRNGITPNNLQEKRFMIAHRLLNLTLALSLAATATGCGAVAYARLEQETAPTPMPTASLTPRQAAATPEQVVQSFYDWYLDYANASESRNPMVDGAYRARPELAPELVAEMDALLGGPAGFHYDPFLMAQDVPTGYEVSVVAYEGDRVTVLVATSFEGHVLAVELEPRDGGWVIRHIGRAGEGAAASEAAPAQGKEALAAAAQQALKFYDWYLGYARGDADGPRSLLSDDAYQTCGFFTPSFIEELDALLASDEPLRADPFLCAQDIPDSVTVEQAVEVAPGVQVTMSSSFAGHSFNVFLREMAPGDWLIDGVQPVTP